MDYHSYIDRIFSYQRLTGFTEALQRGIGQRNGIPVAFGLLDFRVVWDR